MYELTAQQDGMTPLTTFRFATCWELTRQDATVFRFTDHNHPITLDGEDFTPVGGFDSSARQKIHGLGTRNAEFRGMLTSAAITNEDLRAGLYRGAEVVESLVDWRYPWMDVLRQAHYVVGEVSFNGQTWVAQISGFRNRLQVPVGKVTSRNCGYELGGTECGVTIASYTTNDAVVAFVTQRKSFTTTLAQADHYFRYGLLTWTSGANDGLSYEVKGYANTNGKITLVESTAFDIVAGDAFSVSAGCDRKWQTCRDKFSNILNFGGEPWIPGTDAVLKTPNSK